MIERHSHLLELSAPVFSILSGLVDERVGLHYGLLDRDVLQEKASARAIDAGFSSLLDYYYFLRYDEGGEAELSELVETLVVNETYLFREWRPVEVLVDTFITPLCAAGKRPRIWSAACATGEEPVSLAMLLEERGLLDQVEIVASDISSRALAKAKTGKYGKRAIRHVPHQGLFEKNVQELPNGFQVPSHLIDKIRWEKKNLLNDSEIQPLGTFDAILCRNVMIYFSDKTVTTVLDRLNRSLQPEGILVVGISESLLRYGSTFSGEERSGAFIYRKSEKK